ncbi:hypothetical protein [Actinoplanes regularis]|uniref:hypothetical protein n=1 Tax=Actinoplanes regularis TaxID=52697 RepID=UPI000B774691|nr:hypothetical protein [Actinoplanes regularis]
MAYLGALLGAAVSIAANVAHSFIPPDGAPAGWSPRVGAVLLSIFWPVALAVVIELAVRVPWPSGWQYIVVRAVGLLPVAAVAAVVSYRHGSGLLTYYGEDPITTRFGPVAVDGLLLIATMAIVVTGDRAAVVKAALPVVASAAPRPVPLVVPAGIRVLPLVTLRNSQANATGAPVPPSTASGTGAAENFSGGEPAIPPPPPGGRPAAQTRQLWEALKKVNPKLTQTRAAERLGISRWALRSALEATV